MFSNRFANKWDMINSLKWIRAFYELQKKKKKEKIHIIIYLKYENKTYAIVSEMETYFDLLKTDRTLKHKKKKRCIIR